MDFKLPSSLVNRLPVAGTALLWAGFHAWVLNYYFALSWMLSVWDSFIFNICILSSIILVSSLLNYMPKTGIFQLTVGLALILTFASHWISAEALESILPTETRYLEFLSASTPLRWMLGFVIITGSIVGFIYYLRWKDLLEVRNRESDTLALVREAELQKLQLQLQPHFLFNSLNSINALIMVAPDQARQMVQQLSDFLRLTIKRADEPQVSLTQELEYLETYLAIERVRFGHRLEVILNIDKQCKEWSIPTLVLQPLLENAIKFGLYGTTGKISIVVTAEVQANQLEMTISNPFDSDMQPTAGSGFGLHGLKRRLYLIYGQNDLVKTSVLDNRFMVNLIIPFQS